MTIVIKRKEVPKPEAAKKEVKPVLGGSDSLAHIRKLYNVPAYLGGRVIYSGGRGEPKEGTIVGSLGDHVSVNFDDEKLTFHMPPVWKMEYQV